MNTYPSTSTPMDNIMYIIFTVTISINFYVRVDDDELELKIAIALKNYVGLINGWRSVDYLTCTRKHKFKFGACVAYPIRILWPKVGDVMNCLLTKDYTIQPSE